MGWPMQCMHLLMQQLLGMMHALHELLQQLLQYMGCSIPSPWDPSTTRMNSPWAHRMV